MLPHGWKVLPNGYKVLPMQIKADSSTLRLVVNFQRNLLPMLNEVANKNANQTNVLVVVVATALSVASFIRCTYKSEGKEKQRKK